MINHIRTLLMNKLADPGLLELGEEFIEPTFLPKTVPGAAQRYRQVLFGANPDRAMLNYRLYQYMVLLHETDLVEFIMEPDSRITYDFAGRPFFDPMVYVPNVEQRIGSGKSLNLYGPPMVPDSSGDMYRSWIITIKSGSTVDVSEQGVNPVLINNYPYTITGGLSSHIPIVGSPENYFIFQDAVVGSQWFVNQYSRPQASLGTLLEAARAVEEPSLVELFSRTSPRGNTEPVQTFYNLFTEHQEVAYALGGLLLAIVQE